MKRLWTLLAFGGAGLLLSPAAASAQFPRALPSLPGLPSLPPVAGLPGGAPVIVPSVNPFFYSPRYFYTRGYGVSLGGVSVGIRQTSYGLGWPGSSYGYIAPPRYSSYGQTGSYITGAPNARLEGVIAAQRNLAIAQREAGLPGAKAAIKGQWDYEKGNPPPEAVGPMPGPAAVAPAPALEPAAVASGDALNSLLKDIAAAVAKGAKGPSGYVPPLLLADVQFAHTPAGDLINLARKAGALDFPTAFDNPALAPFRAELEKDFAAAAVPVQAGRSPEPEKVARLDATLRKAQDAAGPVVKDLPFEEAIPARQLLNRLAGAVKALKAGAGAGLIDPKWAAEGLTVADLVRHMGKHKLQFGPAPRGGEEAYATMYRNLATYLAVLSQPKK